MRPGPQEQWTQRQNIETEEPVKIEEKMEDVWETVKHINLSIMYFRKGEEKYLSRQKL